MVPCTFYLRTTSTPGPTEGLGQVVLLEPTFIGAEPRTLHSPIPSRRAQRLDAVPHVLQSTFERFIPRNDLRHRSMLHDYMNFLDDFCVF
jgi:hypothetical protein